MFATQCSNPHRMNTATPKNRLRYLPAGCGLFLNPSTASQISTLQKKDRMKMLSSPSFSFTVQIACAFSASAGPTRVARSASAVRNVPARLPSQISGRPRA